MFGLLGSGNLGNDGTFEVLLADVAHRHPEAEIDCMCAGPSVVTAQYGLTAVSLHWDDRVHAEGNGPFSILRKSIRIGLGITCDAWRTASWVRQHDVIMVPGMGTLEGTLRHRPWEMPYSLFLLALCGKIFDVTVAFVCVGASPFPPGITQHMITASARMADLRSYRDGYSREVVRDMGIDVSQDEVFQDLVHARPEVEPTDRETRVVGLGVMAYQGDNSDRARADEIHTGYVEKITEFARWLVTKGYDVKLLIGDQDDEPVALTVRESLTTTASKAGTFITYEPTPTMDSLLRQIQSVDAVVATRYHNVLCALHCKKPTISIGYGAKHHELMSEMGVADYSLPIQQLELRELIAQFELLKKDSESLVRAISEHERGSAAAALEQLEDLDRKLFGTHTRPTVASGLS